MGRAVGTRVGTGVGGRVYSTTSVEADTPELAVAFASAVILPIVELPLASTSAALRFPLEAADAKSEAKLDVTLEADPPFPVPSRRRASFSVRATVTSSRKATEKYTSSSPSVVFSARIAVKASTSGMTEMTFTRARFTTPVAPWCRKLFFERPFKTSLDSRTTSM